MGGTPIEIVGLTARSKTTRVARSKATARRRRETAVCLFQLFGERDCGVFFVTIRPKTRTECSEYDRRSVVILALMTRQHYKAVLTGHRLVTAWRYR